MEQYSAAKLNPGIGLLPAILLVFTVYWPSPACAHELRPAIATLELSGETTVAMTVSLSLEAIIAASIVYVVIENTLTSRLHRWRPVVVFCFGLVHGLGFAGILQEIGPDSGQFAVSLLAFNLGVELGQIAVIAACFLGVGWMAQWPHYRVCVVIPASLAIGIMRFIWFVQRVGLAS